MSDHSRPLEAALRALASRERTEHELRALLERRRFDSAVVDEVVASVASDGLVDDAGYARRFAEDRRLLDRWGNERIARDLERRGIQRELVDAALAGHGPEDELALAVELLDRRFPLPFDGDRERDKAWRMLVRRGYEPDLAYSAVKQHEQGVEPAVKRREQGVEPALELREQRIEPPIERHEEGLEPPVKRNEQDVEPAGERREPGREAA